jgi:hypothetical protein
MATADPSSESQRVTLSEATQRVRDRIRLGTKELARGLVWVLDTVPLARDGLVPIVFVALYVLANRNLHFAGHGAAGEIFGGVIAALLGYLVSYRVRMRGFARGVKIIREIADQSTLSPGRRLYVQMILDRLAEAK